jgi:xanthine/uracil permease
LKKITGPLRRALIYGLISYAGLVVINNSELDLPNMWIAYLPMFLGVYVATQWLDKKIGE